LRGLNLGVGAGESIRFLLGVGAGTGTAERAGESVKAEIRGAGSESANAVSGWRIFIVDALSVSNSLLHNQHDPDTATERNLPQVLVLNPVGNQLSLHLVNHIIPILDMSL
jgi:hypothetical protein